jgi:hypothetical protein
MQESDGFAKVVERSEERIEGRRGCAATGARRRMVFGIALAPLAPQALDCRQCTWSGHFVDKEKRGCAGGVSAEDRKRMSSITSEKTPKYDTPVKQKR